MGASNAAQPQFGPQMRGASTGVQQQERVTRAATTSIVYQILFSLFSFSLHVDGRKYFQRSSFNKTFVVCFVLLCLY
jgi:hypothetical protein